MTIQLILLGNWTFKDANYNEEKSKPLSKITSKVTRSKSFFKEFQTLYKVL